MTEDVHRAAERDRVRGPQAECQEERAHGGGELRSVLQLHGPQQEHLRRQHQGGFHNKLSCEKQL